MKWLAGALRALTLCGAGGFLGYALWLRADWAKRPELYAAQSAPWQTRLMLPGAALALMAVLCMAATLIERKRD
mgnify:CR=1 FL=1